MFTFFYKFLKICFLVVDILKHMLLKKCLFIYLFIYLSIYLFIIYFSLWNKKSWFLFLQLNIGHIWIR